LVDILKGNPYFEKLRTMGEIENVDEYCISFNLDVQKDQRQYNCPLSDEVAAVWVEARDVLGSMDQSVVLHGNNREITGIRSPLMIHCLIWYFFLEGNLIGIMIYQNEDSATSMSSQSQLGKKLHVLRITQMVSIFTYFVLCYHTLISS
jgi:hypothetical protein